MKKFARDKENIKCIKSHYTKTPLLRGFVNVTVCRSKMSAHRGCIHDQGGCG